MWVSSLSLALLTTPRCYQKMHQLDTRQNSGWILQPLGVFRSAPMHSMHNCFCRKYFNFYDSFRKIKNKSYPIFIICFAYTDWFFLILYSFESNRVLCIFMHLSYSSTNRSVYMYQKLATCCQGWHNPSLGIFLSPPWTKLCLKIILALDETLLKLLWNNALT